MFQQMCWLPLEETDAKKVLYLRFCPDRPWKPYWDCPEFAILDYDTPRFPKGLATYHVLRRWGWTLVSSTQAKMKNFTDEFGGDWKKNIDRASTRSHQTPSIVKIRVINT